MPALLRIQLQRVSPTHHAFVFERPNGTQESYPLETKTYLFHDLLHFAVETEAGLQRSFYGRLARGNSYKELVEVDQESLSIREENGMTETIVGAMTGIVKQDLDPVRAMESLRNYLETSGLRVPDWFTVEFTLRIKERMRRLQGQWQGTPFGQTMELFFEVQ